MSSLPSEAIKEFKIIFLKEKGFELTDEQAIELAIQFFNMFEAIYRPIPQDNEDESGNV